MPIDLITAVASLCDVQTFIMGGDLSRTLAKSSHSDIQAAGFALRGSQEPGIQTTTFAARRIIFLPRTPKSVRRGRR
jgi:hypothetical protein